MTHGNPVEDRQRELDAERAGESTGEPDVAPSLEAGGFDLAAVLAEILGPVLGGDALPYNQNPFDVFYSTLADPDQEVFAGSEATQFQLISANQVGVDDDQQRRLLAEARNRFGSGVFDAVPAGDPVRDRRIDSTTPNLAGLLPQTRALNNLSDSGLFDELEGTGLITQAGSREDIYSTVGDLVRGFYDFDDAELARIQRVMYVGGFYGTSMRYSDIQFGVPDEQSYSAWVTAVTRTARLNAAGKQVTTDDVLEEAARTAGIGVDGGFRDRAGVDVVISLSDPASLRKQTDELARSVLGRQATAEEERLAIALIHGMQRESQAKAQTAGSGSGVADQGLQVVGGSQPPVGVSQPQLSPSEKLAQQAFIRDNATPVDVIETVDPQSGDPDDPNTVTEVTAPDIDARVGEQLRSANPGEATAMDLVAQLGNLRQLLSGNR